MACLVAACGVLPSQALAQCATTGTNQACTNPAGTTVSGGAVGILDNQTLTATNQGTITGTTDGIVTVNNANVNNAGLVSGGSIGIFTNNTATVTNSGTITGGLEGIFSSAGAVNVVNTGTISKTNAAMGGAIFGITTSVVNSGTISATGANSNAIDSANGTTVNNTGTVTVNGANGTAINSATAATVTNSGTISSTGGGFSYGINGGNLANVTNSGAIFGVNSGISAVVVNLTNSGSVTAQGNGVGAMDMNVSNSGLIMGTSGMRASGTMNVVNSGAIIGTDLGGFGMTATTIHLVNTGTVIGGFAISPVSSSTVVNAGNIIATNGTAINFGFFGQDTLTILTGSHIQGAIVLGSNDAIQLNGGNNNLTFGQNIFSNGVFTVTGAAPFAVSGNQAASIDVTPFGLADKNLMDFTGGVSGILDSVGGTLATANGPLSTAFAPAERGSAAARVEATFASIPGLAYAGNESPVFKAPTMVAGDGRAVWARAFAGERVQQEDGLSLHAVTDYAGGAVGFDVLARPDLRLGLFAGGGESRMSIALNSGSSRTDTGFGGLYGRYAFASFGAPSFLDFALHGGASSNATSRTINNNLAPGGIEIATASYASAYVSPQIKYGVVFPLWANDTLTPSVKVRYVAGFFGGYTESGSTANLTVANRTTQDLEERGELKLTHAAMFGQGDLMLASVYVGALGLQRIGDTTVNTVLLGANLPFVTPGQNSVVGGLAGLGLEWRMRDGVSLFGAGEYIATSDHSTNVGARGGVRVAF